MGKSELHTRMTGGLPTDVQPAAKALDSPSRRGPGITAPPRQFNRRLFGGLVVAGGVLSVSTSTSAWAAAPPAGAGPYGSGTLGGWTVLHQEVSAPETIQSVVAADGILAFGDSIGVDTFNDLADRLSPSGTTLAMNAQSGRPTAPTVDILGQWATTYGLPRQILMAVGSNDIFNPPGFAAQITRVLTLTGPGVTVYWPEIHVSRWNIPLGGQVADQRNSGWLNVQLQAAAAKHKNLIVIGWASFLAQRSRWIGAYLLDGVHTTVLGRATRNDLISQHVQPPLR